MRKVASKLALAARITVAFIPYRIKFGVVWGALIALGVAFWWVSLMGVL